MTGYVFTYGVDGFGADVAPAHEEGVYLNYDKAFQHLMELNENVITERGLCFYEKGYGEDCYPKTDTVLAKLEEEEDWEGYDKELSKHILTDIKSICEQIIEYGEPPFGMYSMEEVEIHN